MISSKSRLISMMVLILVTVIAIFGGVANATEPCIPSEAIPAVPGTPEIPAVTHEEQVFDYWRRYSWNGPWETNEEAPPFPNDRWQPNVKGDPHGVGVEGAYFRSHGNSGNGDWFYLQAINKTVIVVDTPAVPATPGTPAVPAVVCPEKPTEEPTPTDNPTTINTPATPTEIASVTTVIPVETSTAPVIVIVPEEGLVVIEQKDPVVKVETNNQPTKTVKIHHHESGRVTKTVKNYGPASKLVEEGF